MDAVVGLLERVHAADGIEWLLVIALLALLFWLGRSYVHLTSGVLRRAVVFREKMTAALHRVAEMIREGFGAVRADLSELRRELRELRDELRRRYDDR